MKLVSTLAHASSESVLNQLLLFWTLSGRLIHTMMLMNETPSRPQHLFIVRLWSEMGNLPQAPFRGSVEHIPTGQKFYFTSLDDLSDFIALKAAVLPQSLSKGKEPGQ